MVLPAPSLLNTTTEPVGVSALLFKPTEYAIPIADCVMFQYLALPKRAELTDAGNVSGLLLSNCSIVTVLVPGAAA